MPPEAAVFLIASVYCVVHSLLAMELAGLKGARFYPGSWSEWCSNPRRPIAKGR